MSVTLMIVIALVAAVIGYMYWRTFRITRVPAEHRGLLYRRGHFAGVLAPGRHQHLRDSTAVILVDLRERGFTTTSQTVATRDHASVDISLKGRIKVADALQARDHDAALRLAVHGSLLECVAAVPLAELRADPSSLARQMHAMVAAKAHHFGLEVPALEFSQIDMPPEPAAAPAKAGKAVRQKPATGKAKPKPEKKQLKKAKKKARSPR